MSEEKVNKFEIEKQVYNTQWTNIRHHWDETVKAIRYLSTLIVFAIIPLKFLKITKDGVMGFGVDPEIVTYLKIFIIVMIAVLGLLTFLNQYNHFKRSKEARKVVVSIEKSWGLYTEEGKFIYQDGKSNYQYGKFSGGECRISHSQIQFFFIVAISLIGIGFVYFA